MRVNSGKSSLKASLTFILVSFTRWLATSTRMLLDTAIWMQSSRVRTFARCSSVTGSSLYSFTGRGSSGFFFAFSFFSAFSFSSGILIFVSWTLVFRSSGFLGRPSFDGSRPSFLKRTSLLSTSALASATDSLSLLRFFLSTSIFSLSFDSSSFTASILSRSSASWPISLAVSFSPIPETLTPSLSGGIPAAMPAGLWLTFMTASSNVTPESVRSVPLEFILLRLASLMTDASPILSVITELVSSRW